METLKFTACKHLDFDQSRYSGPKLAPIRSGGVTKLVWERKDVDDNLQLCQFCKLCARLNGPEYCLDLRNAECSDYEEFEHTVVFKQEDANASDDN